MKAKASKTKTLWDTKSSKPKRLCIKCLKNQVYPGNNAGPAEKVCDSCK